MIIFFDIILSQIMV